MSNKTWYCKTHKNWFKKICIACIDDIFHSFGLIQAIETTESSYEWDETYDIIEKL